MADTLLGRVLDGRYRLVEVLFDAGPRGVVYRAQHLRLDWPVAVKVFRDPAGPSFEEIARKLSCVRHPNVEPIQDYGRLEDGRPYLVTEILSGESMVERMARPSGQIEVLALLRDASAGLAEVHAADLVHGNLKPENLFFESHRSGETLKIFDFDLPAERGSHSFIDERMLGCAEWISPEQAKGSSAEPASDLYALGAIAYACLAGVPPHAGDPHVVLSKKIECDTTSLRELSFPVDVDQEVDALILSSLDREPYQRPAAAAVTEQAESLHDQLTLPPMPQPIRSRVPWFGLAATIMGAAALLVAEMRAPNAPCVPAEQPQTGTVRLESLPAGAQILIDGMPTSGVTPSDIHALQYGTTYRVQLRIPGFISWETEVEMDEVTDGAVLAPMLSPLPRHEDPARLTVTGDPHADVYLDHKRIGSPPIVDMTLHPGDHQLTIKSATEVRTMVVEAEPGNSVRYHVP